MDKDSTASEDVITALGYLCLGSRLKRLGERMQGGVAQFLAAQGHAVQPAQLPVLMALHLEGAMTIGALGDRVGISQPGMSRAIAILDRLGLVTSAPRGPDRRQRRIDLTQTGSTLMSALERKVFPAVDAAVAALCADASADARADFLGVVAAIETGLEHEALETRIRRSISVERHD